MPQYRRMKAESAFRVKLFRKGELQMKSKMLMLAIMFLSISHAGKAFTATATVSPSQVPRGAYVNGPEGADDDNFYWQSLAITLGATHEQPATVTITLPAGMTIANTNGNAGNTAFSDEISVTHNSAAATIAVDAGGNTTANTIELDITVDDAVANETIWVMFPVETQINPGVSAAGYAIAFSDADEADVTASEGPQITYRDAGALQIVAFQNTLSGDNDSTSTYGQKYPDSPGALWGALPDLLRDDAASTKSLSAAIIAGGYLSASDDDNGNDVAYTLWASTDSTLSHVNALTSGVTRAIRFDTGGDFTVNEGADGSVTEIATAAFPEGNYFFYLTSSLTGDFPLARSGQLHVRHYPQVKIVGWDYNDDGTFDNTAGHADDKSVTMDTGLYFGYDGTLNTAARQNTDIYIKVEDYDDNARVYLFYSTNAGLTSSNIVTSGTGPNLQVTGLAGATMLTNSLYENQQDNEGFILWNWDVTPVGGSFIAANQYTLYVVACDGKHTSLLASKGTDSASQETIAIKHSPSLVIDVLNEYDSDAVTPQIDIETAEHDVIMLSWGKRGVNGDSDIDDSAVIEFYIAHDADNLSDYASSDATGLRAAVNDQSDGVHRIVTGLSEDDDSQSGSYYSWDLKADFAATGWHPTAGDTYHLYAIIDENKSGGTARVVALGDNGKLTLNQDLTAGSVNGQIVFTNSTFARLYDPPVEGVTVYGDQTYRMRFEAFDYDDNADIGIYVINTAAAGAGIATATVADLEGWNAGGHAYCLTSTTGDDAAASWLSENNAASYDLTVRLPSEANSRYSTDIEAGAVDMADGEYWVYIGNPAETLYRAPGTITFKNIADANKPSQKNLMLTPSIFTVSKGDSMTFAVRAADQGMTIDLIDTYIAVEKEYFDIVTSSAPFSDGPGTGTLIANETIDDAANNRWILHVTVFNSGAPLNPADADLGDVEATFTLVSKGTTNALNATSSIYFVNEPANNWVSKFMNDGSNVSINVQQNNAIILPRGIIEGIVKFEGREHSNYTVTFDLRNRGSYVNIEDETFYARNDADPSIPGVQLALDNDGKFTLFKVPAGTFDFVVMYDRYLAKKQEIKIEAGLDTLFVNFGKLLGGDCIGYTDSAGAVWPNNRISAEDVNRISDAFLTTSVHAWWNDNVHNYMWADIDESGQVGIVDLQMATANYTGSNNDGAQPVWAKPAAQPVMSNIDAFVQFNNLPGDLRAGQSYTMQVVIHNASAVRGYYLNVNYDQSVFTFDGIVKGGFITGSSQSFPVVGDGAVGLANAVYGDAIFSGDGVLAEMTFVAKKDGAFNADMIGIQEITVVNGNMLSENLLAEAPSSVSNAPSLFTLGQNFPNPFNPTTTIAFNVPQASHVTLKVYDVIGRCVRTLAAGTYAPGSYSVLWDARDENGSMVSAGTYFYTVTAGDYHDVKRMMFLK